MEFRPTLEYTDCTFDRMCERTKKSRVRVRREIVPEIHTWLLACGLQHATAIRRLEQIPTERRAPNWEGNVAYNVSQIRAIDTLIAQLELQLPIGRWRGVGSLVARVYGIDPPTAALPLNDPAHIRPGATGG